MKGKKIIVSLILISCFISFGYYYKSVYLSNSIEAINMRTENKKYVYPLGEIVGIKATTDGVVLLPSAFGITTASPPSITDTHEFVVPKSIPIIFPIFIPPKLLY